MSPSLELEMKRQKLLTRSPVLPSSNLLYIGRSLGAPFVFSSKGKIKYTNRTWLQIGEIDEVIYDMEVSGPQEGDGMEDDDMNGGGERRGLHASSSSQDSKSDRSTTSDSSLVIDLTLSDEDNMERHDGEESRLAEQMPHQDGEWSEWQDKALWLAQLRYGEGRNWRDVVRRVNQARGKVKHGLKACQERWALLKTNAFGDDSTG